MPSAPATLSIADRPISDYLASSFEALKASVPADRRGYATAGVTLKGVEVGAAWQPKTDLWLTGYAGRLWGGGWEAGSRATFTW